MIQFDAGPGDHSDREWEGPEHKATSQAAKRRRVTLPPWALLAILVAVIILLCVGLIMIVRAIGGRGAQEEPTPTPVPTVVSTAVLPATATADLAEPTATSELPTPTVVLPTEGPVETQPATEIGPGATVIVKGTGGQGLRLRAQPTTGSGIVTAAKEGTKLTVVEGPQEANGYVWWKVKTANGQEGWGASDWLVLQATE